MSAIEMMDPKMDAGMLCNQVQRHVYTLDQAVKVQLNNQISYLHFLSETVLKYV